ncbi:MAG: CBS domain-containing protein [Sandaracinaceae bacterium]|nr:CBS domain-containing protein [Sandaracinaceae bacterium]
MRQLVREAMTEGPVTMRHDATVREAARRMKRASIGDVIVMRDRKAYGILTDRDIVVRCIAEAGEPTEVRIGEICSTNLLTVGPNDTLASAEELMRRRAVRRLVVEEDGLPIGILTLADLESRRHPESPMADIAAAPPNL